jgi:hypothetical protein
MASPQPHLEVEIDTSTGAALGGVPVVAMLVPPNISRVVSNDVTTRQSKVLTLTHCR